MHLRNVPTCPEILGEAALANEPDIKIKFSSPDLRKAKLPTANSI